MTQGPPKKSRWRSDKAAEIKWFNGLPAVDASQLVAGDLILKKDYAGESPVVALQEGYEAALGSKFTCHAFLYTGSGGITECSAHKGGVFSGQMDEYAGVTLLAYRALGDRAGEGSAAALRIASAWSVPTGSTPQITYSQESAVLSWFGSSTWGPSAARRAAQVRRGEIPESGMICSEFVAFCYQAVDPPFIRLDAKHTATIRLEDYLNGDGSGHFGRLGRLGAAR